MTVKVASGDQLVAFAGNTFLRVDGLGQHRVDPLLEIAFKDATLRVEARDQPPEPTGVGDIGATHQRQEEAAHREPAAIVERPPILVVERGKRIPWNRPIAEPRGEREQRPQLSAPSVTRR